MNAEVAGSGEVAVRAARARRAPWTSGGIVTREGVSAMPLVALVWVIQLAIMAAAAFEHSRPGSHWLPPMHREPQTLLYPLNLVLLVVLGVIGGADEFERGSIYFLLRLPIGRTRIFVEKVAGLALAYGIWLIGVAGLLVVWSWFFPFTGVWATVGQPWVWGIFSRVPTPVGPGQLEWPWLMSAISCFAVGFAAGSRMGAVISGLLLAFALMPAIPLLIIYLLAAPLQRHSGLGKEEFLIMVNSVLSGCIAVGLTLSWLRIVRQEGR